ncbi:DUF3576 domain-containing protein [Palleronia sp. KMU-117]|uniref:DUF3576 domain-containing protein n=1 Tax=Palleronia sp. KMU-117 TaxID=3434108 RepID=UPI003D70D715
MKSQSGTLLIALSVLALSACDGLTPTERTGQSAAQRAAEQNLYPDANPTSASVVQESSIFDLFSNENDPNTTVEVNKYIWNAALQILDFMPIETVDPFSGVIVMGYGTPPGSGTAYRATVLIDDPALDARSLNVALATRNGPVDAATTRAVEDAILTRARELRIRDNAL